ncbi:hypothetical protein GOQ28_02410 [Bordetella sp. 02P26C-1]|nr:hypothetical protein [Bordetella sp. 02P26C-1]
MTVMKSSLPDMLSSMESDCEDAPIAMLSLRDALRAATRAEHDDIENRMNLARDDYTREEYGQLLQRYHAFYEVFEAFLSERARASSRVADFYYRDRRKVPWLESDLHALGLPRGSLRDAALADDLREQFADDARLLGALYVVEGSMLGGAVLAKQFKRRFELTAQSGLQFFTGYGADTKARWMDLQQLLSQYDDDARARSEAIEGARRMFQLFGQHLTA